MKKIGIRNPYEKPLRLFSKLPLFGNINANNVPAKNAPRIYSISNNTATPTKVNINAIELLIPISSGSLPSNILEKS